MANPQFKTMESLKGKKIAITGLGGTVHVAFNYGPGEIRRDPEGLCSGVDRRATDPTPHSLESGYVDAALLSPPVTFGAQKKGFNKFLDIGAMVEMPGGGLTALAKTIQERPAETKRVIRSLQMAKDEIRKSKPKTLDLDRQALKNGQGSGERNLRSFSHYIESNRNSQPRRHGDIGEVRPVARPPRRPQSGFHRNRGRPTRNGSRQRNGIQNSIIPAIAIFPLAREVGESLS